MLKNRILTTIAVCLATGLVAAGCGSSDDDSTSADASLTKAAFIKQADKTCTQGNKKKIALSKAYGKENNLSPSKPLTKARLEDMVATAILPEIQRQAEALASMTTPAGDEAKVDAVAEAVEEGVEEAEANPDSVLNPTTSPFVDSNKVAVEYGFKVCGQN